MRGWITSHCEKIGNVPARCYRIINSHERKIRAARQGAIELYGKKTWGLRGNQGLWEMSYDSLSPTQKVYLDKEIER